MLHATVLLGVVVDERIAERFAVPVVERVPVALIRDLVRVVVVVLEAA
jgi:hypothetical protein